MGEEQSKHTTFLLLSYRVDEPVIFPFGRRARQTLSSFRLIHWLVIFVLGATLLPVWVLAQGGTGPTPNPVLSLAVAPGAPDKVLAGTLNSPKPPGIYRAKDGGRTWEIINQGLRENMSVASLAFDPQNGKLIFAA